MKRLFSLPQTLLQTLLWLTLLCCCFPAQTPPSPAGHWVGGIDLGSVNLGLSIDLAQKSAGQWTGTISILAQALKDRALTNVAVKDGQVTFALPEVAGEPTFTGKLAADGQAITGELKQSGKTFPFRLERTSKDAPDRYGATPAKGAPGAGFTGDWQGTLEAGGMTMRLIFRITKAADHSFTMLLDSPDQGVTQMKADSATIKEKSFGCELKRIGAGYQGTLNQDGSKSPASFSKAEWHFRSHSSGCHKAKQSSKKRSAPLCTKFKSIIARSDRPAEQWRPGWLRNYRKKRSWK
jgi:hypothetical protein